MYFLGFVRLQGHSTRENDDRGTSSLVKRRKSCTDKCSGCSTTTCTTSSLPRLFHCQHNQHHYLCFPPYCAPGGLRSQLFPTAPESCYTSSSGGIIFIQETQHPTNDKRTFKSQTTSFLASSTSISSTSNPLDLLLQNPYILTVLPAVVQKALQDCRDDWDTLGGSRCTFVRNSLLTTSQCCDQRCDQYQHQQQGGVDINYSCKQEETEKDQLLQKSQQRLQEEDHIIQSVSRSNQEKKNKSKIITMTATEQPTSTPTSVHGTANGSSNNNESKVLPQAILVYHESAHSIVFRDHLRRQQGAIRKTSSMMEQQNNERRATSRSPSRFHPKEYAETNGVGNGDATSAAGAAGMSRGTSTIDEVSETDEAAGGYESSGSTKSNRSTRSQSSNTTVKSGDNSSVTSGGGSSRGSISRKKYSRKGKSNSLPLPPLRKMSSPSLSPSPPPSSHPPPSISSVVVANFQPVIEPLEALELNAKHVFEPLFDADPFLPGGEEDDGLPTGQLTQAECEVVEMLKSEKAVVKTVRNQDWTSFLNKFKPEGGKGKGERVPGPGERRKKEDDDRNEEDGGGNYPFNSFVTSTSLLPSCAKKMRCFGSTNEYTTGAVFALPTSFPNDASEDEAAKRTRTWSWPSGYSAKTEFNIDHRGNLINGREEALVPLSRMREMNHSYLNDTDYVVGGRMIKGGLQVSI